MRSRRTRKVGLGGAIICAATALALAAPATSGATIPAGFDLFETDPAHTAFDFQGTATTIPPGFFDPGSDPFTGHVVFGGVPLETFDGKSVGDADTIVRRLQPANPAPDAFVPIELVALHLQSVQPITVTYNNGQNPQLWDVGATLSEQRPSQGQILIHQPGTGDGGTFDSQLQVVPLLVFMRLSDGVTRTLDAAALPPQVIQQNLTFTQSGGVWRGDCVLPALAVPGLTDGFCPGETPGNRPQKVLTDETAALAEHGVYPAQPALEHFKCYSVKQLLPFQKRKVRLADQFSSRKAKLVNRSELCNPAQKNREPFQNRAAHLQCYVTSGPDIQRVVAVQNQFGSQRLVVHRARQLCVPSEKRLQNQRRFPKIKVPIDHYQCYTIDAQTPILAVTQPGKVKLTDEFGVEHVQVGKPYKLCAPAKKKLGKQTTPIQHPVKHLVCYRIRDDAVNRKVRVRNQLEATKLIAKRPTGLCVPSNKLPQQ